MSVRRRNKDVVMDPAKTGIVWARKRPHPQRQLFTSVPIRWPDHPEAELPPAEMPPEMQQVLAIHLFDNLRCMTAAQVTELLRTVLEEIRDAEGQWSVDDLVAKYGPAGPVYKLVKNPRYTDETAPMGTGGSMWVPIATPDEQFETLVEDQDDDIEAIPYAEMTDEQREKLQARLDQHHLDKARRENLDVPAAATPEPVLAQWQIERDELLSRLEKKAAATDPTEGPQ